jgi:class 3 adenylate cyclase
VILQAAIFLSIATYALFGLADITSQSGGVQSTRFRYMIAVPLLATLFGLSFLGIVRRYWQVGAILFGLAGSLCVFMTAILLDAETEFHFEAGTATINYLLVMAFVALVPLTTIGTILLGLIVQAVHAILIFQFASFPLNVSLFYLGHVVSVFVVVICVAYWRERLIRQGFADELRMQEEKETFKGQLLSFMSMETLNRLQHGGRSVADVFGEVTVLFCDIVDFTLLAERIAPKHLVELLSSVFSRIDELAAEHQVEKVKTIGDAYMAIAGASEESPNSAEDMACFALAIMREASVLSDAIGYPLQFRIGMHTGSLIGGVIGRQKMTYDYWGKTVNVASRLESTAQPGRIQVSEATYWRLRTKFRFERRGRVDLKGIGSVEGYYLLEHMIDADQPAS